MSKIFLGLLFLTLFSEMPYIKDILKYTDELSLLLSIIIILYKNFLFFIKEQTITKIFFIFLFYLMYQILLYKISIFDVKLFPMLIQSLINIKLFLITLGIFYIISQQDNKMVNFLWKFMIFWTIVGWSLNAVVGESWNIFFGDHPGYRYGLLRKCGFYGHISQTGYMIALTLTTYILLNNKTIVINTASYIKKFFYFIIIDFFITLMIGVRKGIFMNVPYGISAISVVKGYKRYIFLIFSAFFIGSFLYIIKDTEIFKNTIMNFADMVNPETSYVRGMMFYWGWWLFFYFFPFGTGAGTFGTKMSEYNTFDVYNYVGFNMDRFFQNGSLSGVYDSGLGSLVAENGFIGVILIALFIYYYFKFFRKIFDTYNYLIFSILTWFSIILAITEPNWQNGMFAVFYVINLLYIYSKNFKIKYKLKI